MVSVVNLHVNRDDIVEAIQKLASGVIPPAMAAKGIFPFFFFIFSFRFISWCFDRILKFNEMNLFFLPPLVLATPAVVTSSVTEPRPASPAVNSSAQVPDQKKVLENFVECAKLLLSVMKDGTPTEVVNISTNLVKVWKKTDNLSWPQRK